MFVRIYDLFALSRELFFIEQISNDIVRIFPGDSRGKHITDVLKLREGDELKIGVINSRPAVALVGNATYFA